MINASAYKYTKMGKICLPTLIKPIDEDKITHIIKGRTTKK